MTSRELKNPTFEAGEKKPGPISRRIERVKRVADFISTVGFRDGMSTIQELRNDHNAGNIRTVKAEALRHPFFMTAAYSDVAMFTEIVGRKLYDLPPNTDWLIDGRPIVDIGANIGASAAFFASRYAQSTVTAIEPSLRNYELLAYNAGQYQEQIDPWNYALALNNGYVGLSNEEVGSVGHHAVYQYDTPSDSKNIDAALAITPSEVVERAAGRGKIGLLKINIEGAESVILASSSSDVLLQSSNVAIIEAHDRKVDGTSIVVDEAAKRNGLVLFDQRGPFKFFLNSRRNRKHKITL